MKPDDFVHGTWGLFEAIDALYAYDTGATDSGVQDPGLKASVKKFISGLGETDFRVVVSLYARRLLTDNMLAQGYGLEDVLGFVRWMSSELGLDV